MYTKLDLQHQIVRTKSLLNKPVINQLLQEMLMLTAIFKEPEQTREFDLTDLTRLLDTLSCFLELTIPSQVLGESFS